MSTQIDDIVVVNITRETAKLAITGFDTALIFGIHNRFAESYRTYTDIEEVEEDFETTDEEWKAANALFAQDNSPESIVIGKRAANVAQVNVITVTAEDSHDYNLTINSSSYDFTSGIGATAISIAASLISLASAGSEPVSFTNNLDGTYDIEADISGDSFTISVDDNQSSSNTVENVSVITELADLREEYDDWYALIVCRRATEAQQIQDIKQVAAWVESKLILYGTAIDEANMITSSTDDIATYLKNRAYDRTFIFYSTDEEDYPEAAAFGVLLPNDPGTDNITLKFKTLSGIAVDTLSSTATTQLAAKYANYYETVAGINMISSEAIVSSNEYIDVIYFVDWLQTRIAEGIFLRLANADKIPFTTQGIDVIVNEIMFWLERGVDAGGLVEGTSIVTPPDIEDIPTTEKAIRYFNNVRFEAELAGAIHKVRVVGKLTV